MTWLFVFYHRLAKTYDRAQDRAQALHYGQLMMDREPFNPPVYLALFEMFLAHERKHAAREMLNRFERDLLPDRPEIAIQSFMLFWQRFHDRAVLRRAEALLVPRAKQPDSEPYFTIMLSRVRRLLEATEPSSRTSSTQAAPPRPGSRSPSQEVLR
jgi:hypothetical protein